MRIFIAFILIFEISANLLAQDFDVKESGISTGHSDYAAIPWNGGVIFTSDIPIKDREGNFKNILFWKDGKAEILSKKFVSEYHDGPASVTEDGKLICYSSNMSGEGIVDKAGLFFSEFDGESWSDPIPFQYNSNEYINAHPSLSPDGSMLFFSSTMAGGEGQSDIYLSKRTEDGWSEPENLGRKINTGRTEIFPYYHKSGRLYFSSNAGNTLGGIDIFYSVMNENGEWEFPTRLEAPINSDADDFAFYANDDQTAGYFSSSRHKGFDRIYSFELKEPKLKNCEDVSFDQNCVTFFENGPGRKDTVDYLTFLWDLGDGSSIEGIEVEHCYDKPGMYHVTLSIKDSITGALEKNVSEFDYQVKPMGLPFLDVNYGHSSNSQCRLTVTKTKITNLRCSNCLWKIDGKWVLGESILITENTQSLKLVVFGRNEKDKNIQHCYSIDPAVFFGQ